MSPKTLYLFAVTLILLYHSIFRMEFVMHSGKKCFFDEEACLEDLKVCSVYHSKASFCFKIEFCENQILLPLN